MQSDISEFGIFIISAIISLLIIPKRKMGYICIVILTLIPAILYAVNMPVFSPIDEGAHLAYINYICDNARLPIISDMMNTSQLLEVTDYCVPSGIMYEAVHPPMYYVLMAVLCRPFRDVTVRLWICRGFGVVVLCLLIMVIYRWIIYMVERGILKSENQNDYVKVALILCLMPGLITRFITVSNEGIAVLMTTFCLYSMSKCMLDGINHKRLIGISILIPLCLLTKITAAFIIVLWLLILIYYKKYKQMTASVCSIAVLMAPWFLYNMKIYGALMGTEEHVEFARPIVNGGGEPIEIFPAFIIMFKSMLYPQESVLVEIGSYIIGFFDIMIIIGLIWFSIKCIKGVFRYLFKVRLDFQYDFDEKQDIISIIYWLSIVGNILILIISTVDTRINMMLGRYLYLSILPVLFIVFKYMENQVNSRKIILCSIIFLITVLSMHCLQAYIEASETLMSNIFSGVLNS